MKNRKKCIGKDEIWEDWRILRVGGGNDEREVGKRKVDILRIRINEFRCRDIEVEIKKRWRLKKRMKEVVEIKNKGKGIEIDREEMLIICKKVWNDMKRVGVVGKRIDKGKSGILGKLKNKLMRGGEDNDRIKIEWEKIRSVGDGLDEEKMNLRKSKNDSLEEEMEN